MTPKRLTGLITASVMAAALAFGGAAQAAADVEMGVDDGRRCSFVVRPRSPKSTTTGPTALAVDLHGLLVREALAVVTQCLNFR